MKFVDELDARFYFKEVKANKPKFKRS